MRTVFRYPDRAHGIVMLRVSEKCVSAFRIDRIEMVEIEGLIKILKGSCSENSDTIGGSSGFPGGRGRTGTARTMSAATVRAIKGTSTSIRSSQGREIHDS